MPPSTGQLICAKCKSDHSDPKRPMLQCSSCKKGWHTCMSTQQITFSISFGLTCVVDCHGPGITWTEYKAMYEAELNKNEHPEKLRFSNWCCSMCPTPSSDRSVIVRQWLQTYYTCNLRTFFRNLMQVISSDEEENTPQLKRNAAKPSNSVSPAASTPVEDVIDLTEDL